MQEVIFDSFSWMDEFDYLKEHWKEDYGEDTPSDEVLYSKAFDLTWMDYEDVISRIKDQPFTVIMDGQLGLWYGHPDVYAMVSPDEAFACKSDDLKIVYDDGDIWVYQYHHDGCNVLRVRGIKDYWDVPEEDYDEWYAFINERDPIPEDEKFTFSLVEYFKDYLSKEALKDYEENYASKEIVNC